MQFQLLSKAFNCISETYKRTNGELKLTCMSIAKPVILVCNVKDQRKHSAPSKSSFPSSVLKEHTFLYFRWLKTSRAQRCLIIFVPNILSVYMMTRRWWKLPALACDSVWSPLPLPLTSPLHFSIAPLNRGWRCLCPLRQIMILHVQGSTVWLKSKIFFLPFKEGKGHPKCHIFWLLAMRQWKPSPKART